MLQRSQRKSALADLLDLWHGNKYTTGWASPTLALNIALLSRPDTARHLAEQIYVRFRDEKGNYAIPEFDKELIDIINKGYKLYTEGRKG